MNSLRSPLLVCLALVLAGTACESPMAVRPSDSRDGSVRDLSVLVDAGPCGPCLDATPFCDVKSRHCVGCRNDVDCPDDTLCKQSRCMPGCSAQHSMCGDAGSCDVDLGVCRGCASNDDCTNPKLPVCDVPTGHCAVCSTQNDHCLPGTYCSLDGGVVSCKPGCKADLDCQIVDGGTVSNACCQHVCVDLARSLPNCGGCGKACGLSGCCGGQCIDSQTDVKNCGTCGTVCPVMSNVPVCKAGACGSGACVAGFADCNKDPADGCEVSTDSDVKNCGACANACGLANANNLCVVGQCAISFCKAGFRDCDLMPANGCEVDSKNDPNNCGQCGTSCAALPHANAGCAMSVCTIGTCKAGYADCDKMDANGCESPISADPANCNGCGVICPAGPNVLAVCTNGVCGVNGCLPNFADCNKVAADGCEVNIATDIKNCGACMKACAVPANATPACKAGVCGIAKCNAGFADCDNSIADGCEQQILTDANNCGGCGVACMAMQSCVNGACTLPVSCSNGSQVDCNVGGSTLINGSAWVDSNPPMGWVQCFGFTNTVGDDIGNTAMNNCLNTTRLRLRLYDANNTVVVDVYHQSLNSLAAWPVAAAYLDGCNCKGALVMATCSNAVWPCANNSVFYSSTNGTGGGGCGGYNAGGPTLSNGHATPFTIAVAQVDAKELWAGPCYGVNTTYVGYHAALYR